MSSSEWVFLNQEYLKQESAKVVLSHSPFLYGWGCFDTILALRGRGLFLDQHVSRIRQNFELLGIPGKISVKEIDSIIKRLLELESYSNARVRLQFFPEPVSWDRGTLDAKRCITLIQSQAIWENYFEEAMKQQLRLSISTYIRSKSMPSGLKCIGVQPSFFAKMEAKKNGWDDTVLLTHDSYVVEGSSFNIFFIQNDTLCTPHLDTGCLPGVTRGILLNLVKKEKKNPLKIEESFYTPSQLKEADEVFISSSIRGIVPIVQIEEKLFPIGTKTQRMQRLYFDFLRDQSKN